MTLWVGPAEGMEAALAERSGRVLLAVRYGEQAPGGGDADHPLLEVPNAVLGDAPRLEIWSGLERATPFRRDELQWAEDGRALFGCCTRRAGEDLEAVAHETYRGLFALLDERGYPGLQRVWNYVPGINEDEHGLERYQRFNAGRSRGFEERFGEAAQRHACAASAVGTPGEALRICFAAGREPGIHIENPRQVSPCRYPPEYGPRSPTFARGTLAPAGWGEAFFLSGTASVVGHATTHAGDLRGQIEETLTNIEALLGGAAPPAVRRRADAVRFDLLKIYVRHREHLGPIREAIARRFDPSTPAIYLLADICRKDLLLEIEGVSLPGSPRAAV